jgi:hypothetical protein
VTITGPKLTAKQIAALPSKSSRKRIPKRGTAGDRWLKRRAKWRNAPKKGWS